MRSRWLLVLAVFVMAVSAVRAQSTQELVFTADPGVAGRYTASATFVHDVPAGIADAAFLAAPIDGALTIALDFHPVVGITTGFFQVIELDQTSFSGLLDVTGHVVLGPLDIVAGPHRLGVIAAAPLPHNVPINGRRTRWRDAG
jgi:hypothetical protein